MILLSDFSESNGSGSLLMNECSKSCLSFDEAVWDIELSAECGEMEDELDWVNIVSDDDELSLLRLDEGGDVVKSKLDGERLGACLLSSLTFNLGVSLGLESIELFFMGLWLVLTEELEQLLGLVLLKGVRELGDLWGNLESSHENSLLSLHLDVLGPSNKSSEILLVHDVPSDSVASLVLGEQIFVFFLTSGGVLFLLSSDCSFATLLNLYNE